MVYPIELKYYVYYFPLYFLKQHWFEPAEQSVQKTDHMMLQPLLENNNLAIVWILNGMQYNHNRHLFLRMDHKCNYNVLNFFPFYIPL